MTHLWEVDTTAIAEQRLEEIILEVEINEGVLCKLCNNRIKVT